MTYNFARIKTHPKLDLSGWYLVIRKEDVGLTMEMHKSAATTMFLKFFRDPHLFDQKGAPRNENGTLFNPIKLAAGWIESALKGLARHGVIYMNHCHGMLFSESVDVLETRHSETRVFPKGDDHKEGVKITVSRWAAGEHYYLSASNNRIFSKPKYDTYEEAMAEARLYAFAGNISFKPADHLYTREGD